MDVRDRIKAAPMTRFQVRVVVICLLVNMADGFDVLVMSFTSIGVGDEWGLSGRELGVLLSSGLVGMAVGSLFIAPLADRVGRRTLTLSCIVVCCLGLVLSAVTPNWEMLAVFRAITGISGAVLISVGGIVGALLFSALATRLKATMLTVVLLVLGAVLMGLFGLSTGNLALSLVAGVGLGLTLNGAIAGMYAITPTYYSAQSRATALGWVIGFGRLGAIVAPLLVGELVDGGWDPADIYYLFVVPVLLAAVAVALVRSNKSSRDAELARVRPGGRIPAVDEQDVAGPGGPGGPGPGFPRDIGRPATGALAAAGYRGLADLTAVTEAQLLALHGVGPKAVERLVRAMAEHGLSFCR